MYNILNDLCVCALIMNLKLYYFWLSNFSTFSIQQKLLALRINGNKQTLGVSMEIENTLKCFLTYARS